MAAQKFHAPARRRGHPAHLPGRLRPDFPRQGPGHRRHAAHPEAPAQQAEQRHIQPRPPLDPGQSSREEGRDGRQREQPVPHPGGQPCPVPGAPQQIIQRPQSRSREQRPARLEQLGQRRQLHQCSSRAQNPPLGPSSA